MQISLLTYWPYGHYHPVTRWLEVGALVANSSQVDNPTIWQYSGFDHPRHHWSLINHFQTNNSQCALCSESVALQQPKSVHVTHEKQCSTSSADAHKPSWRLVYSGFTSLFNGWRQDLWMHMQQQQQQQQYLRGLPISRRILHHCNRVNIRVFSGGNDSFKHSEKSFSPRNNALQPQS